jgi:hypothetical protein
MFKAIDYFLSPVRRKELDNEILEEFSPYMVSRYLTFYDKDFTEYANDTVNTYGNVFKTKEDQFRFYEQIIPKVKKRRVVYIKKPREEVVKDKMPMAIPEFYSKREMEMFNL